MALTPFNPAKAGRGSNEKQKILYVEDEDMNWEVTEFALRERYDIDRAKTSDEAFAKLRRNKYELILMDIQLGGSDLNGIEITKVLKGNFEGKTPLSAIGLELPSETPVVFVTAYQARYKKDELLQVGGDDLIFKPVDFTKLSLVMSRLLVRRAMNR